MNNLILDHYPIKLYKAVETLMSRPGECTPELRQAVEAYAGRLSGGIRENAHIPNELVSYINKVSLYAYQITHEDVQQLKESGYSEDAIFEITLCASVGASLARLERGIQASLDANNAS